MSTPATAVRHFDAIYDFLPSELKAGIDDLLGGATRESTVRNTLDQLIQFSLGRTTSNDDLELRKEWELQVPKAQLALHALQAAADKGKKRDRDDDVSTTEANPSKKVKLDFVGALDPEDTPLYTLHAISATSPVRKKVHIAIHRKSMRLINPTSGAQEMSIPLKSAFRAFLISTPGKSKPHWTVVILADTDSNQIIFGLDAIPPSLTTTAHPTAPQSHPKGSEAKPALKAFLSHLPPHVPVLEPSTSQFRSASGEPHIDAYLRAKDGHLLFFKEGILFGEKRPCMWIGIDEIESVRTLSATGRTFSLFVKRVDEMKGEEEIEGEETEFSMIDGKQQDSVSQWVHDNKRRFGAGRTESPKDTPGGSGAVDELVGQEETPDKPIGEDSEDLEDDDYQSESESDGGSASSDSSEGGGGSGDEGEGDQESDGEGEEEDEGEEEEFLDPAKHPLMAPGAVPRLSKAAINAVIGMVEQDLMGGSSSKARPQNGHESELDDEDEYASEDVDELE
ncbi:hypothetical protein BU17DRAFT_47742 [Hysterangium stoloniferum]|nr:hypothetical protein BU17DRAFT_47742 [Hysterangium stoloniferum]